MKKKQKKNWLLRIGSVALLFTLISTCLLGGTLAKYISSASGTDTARVAKFKFDVTSGINTATNTVSLFDTAYGSTVQSDGTDKIVAPGTTGHIDLVFNLITEVETAITFAISETNAQSIPIVYEYGGNYYSSALAAGTHYLKFDGAATETAVTIAPLASLSAAPVTVTAPHNGPLATQTITWHWAFEEYDSASNLIPAADTRDTGFGNTAAAGSAATVSVTIEATAVQVD